MFFHTIYIYCIFVFVIIFLGGRPKFCRKFRPLPKNGQKEFPTPLAGRADQVLPLYRTFFCFITSFKVMIFLICKKIDLLPFCRQ